jgi:hypothetical protein
MVDGIGGESGLIEAGDELERPTSRPDLGEENGAWRQVLVNEIVIECPVVVEVVGDALAGEVQGAIVADVLGQVAQVIRDA